MSEELGLSSWSKPSTTEFPLTNLPNWREMVNPDGKRCVCVWRRLVCSRVAPS